MKHFLRMSAPKQSMGAIALAAMFAACGGDSSSGSDTPEKVEVVSSIYNLGDCTDEIEGDTVFVRNEKTDYICLNGKWVTSSDTESSSSEGSSSSVEQSSSSNTDNSSSSVSSSSSETQSSSSSGNVNCSALLDEEEGWSWSVPRECRFNPAIDYGMMTDERDGKTYRTVKVGDQTWMAENLNYADSVTTPSLLKRSWCYNNVAANCDVAGRLYTWAAALDSVKTGCGYGRTCSPDASPTLPVQGICPTGWHLPSQSEWETLFTAVDGQSAAGKALKSQSGWYSGNGTDAFGFSALPAGIRSDYGSFINGGYNAYFWSAPGYPDYYAYNMYLFYDYEDAYLYYSYKYNGAFSVRCVENSK